jgi:hypothetical protein
MLGLSARAMSRLEETDLPQQRASDRELDRDHRPRPGDQCRLGHVTERRAFRSSAIRPDHQRGNTDTKELMLAVTGQSCPRPPRRGGPARDSGPRALPQGVAPACRARCLGRPGGRGSSRRSTALEGNGADERRHLLALSCHKPSRCPVLLAHHRFTPSSVTRDHTRGARRRPARVPERHERKGGP